MATTRDEFDEHGGDVRELTREEVWALFDGEARRLLGLSGEEFLRAWDAGAYDGPDEDTRALYLYMLTPQVRDVPLPS